MPFIVEPPSLRGEIKKARASNYTWLRALCEFIDNSLDALCKHNQGLYRIYIKFITDTNDKLVSIHISDNCEIGISDNNVWNWTYERNREDKDNGEYGTGFKAGSVNISSNLKLFTNDKGIYRLADADWDDMSLENRWTPVFSELTEEQFKKYHSFDTGTTFVLKNLHTTTIPANNKFIISELCKHIKITYKYSFHNYHNLQMKVNNHVIDHMVTPNPIKGRKIAPLEEIPKSYILVYKNSDNEYEPIVFHEGVYHKMNIKNGVNRRCQNGNLNINAMRGDLHGAQQVDSSTYENESTYELIDVIKFMSRDIYHLCNKWFMNERTLDCPYGYIDMIRKNRTLSNNSCTALNNRGDSWACHIYHELIYQNRLLDTPLGIQFNKNNDSRIQSEEIEACILWCQRLHENIIKGLSSNFGKASDAFHKHCIAYYTLKYETIRKKNHPFNLWKGVIMREKKWSTECHLNIDDTYNSRTTNVSDYVTTESSSDIDDIDDSDSVINFEFSFEEGSDPNSNSQSESQSDDGITYTFKELMNELKRTHDDILNFRTKMLILMKEVFEANDEMEVYLRPLSDIQLIDMLETYISTKHNMNTQISANNILLNLI